MYWLLKDGDTKYVWHEDKEEMFQLSEDATMFFKIKPSLQQLSKFCPDLTLLKKQDIFPKEM